MAVSRANWQSCWGLWGQIFRRYAEGTRKVGPSPNGSFERIFFGSFLYSMQGSFPGSPNRIRFREWRA